MHTERVVVKKPAGSAWYPLTSASRSDSSTQHIMAPTPYEIKRMPVEIRPEGSIAPMSNPMFKGEPPYSGAWADCAYDPETPGWIHHPGVHP